MARDVDGSVTHYNPALDGLRGLAIVSVMLFHAYKHVFPHGWIGVDAFFVLSGFLITRLLSAEFTTTAHIDVWRFYLRRALRLMPAFLTMLICYTVYVCVCSVQLQQDITAILLSLGYVMNWVRAFECGPQGFLGHTWSLALEEQFYLLWPAILMLTRFRVQRRWLLALLAAMICWRLALALAGSSDERIYNGGDTHADGLLLGCCLALTPWSPAVVRLAARFAMVPLLFLAASTVQPASSSVLMQAGGFTVYSLAAAWLVLAAQGGGLVVAALSLKPLRFTGRISYGLYIWHWPLLAICPDFLPHGPANGLAVLGIAYAVAAASYRFLEQPCLRMKARYGATVTLPPRPVWTATASA